MAIEGNLSAIGAGLATMGMIGAGVGVGNVFAAFIRCITQPLRCGLYRNAAGLRGGGGDCPLLSRDRLPDSLP